MRDPLTKLTKNLDRDTDEITVYEINFTKREPIAKILTPKSPNFSTAKIPCLVCFEGKVISEATTITDSRSIILTGFAIGELAPAFIRVDGVNFPSSGFREELT